MYQMRICRLLVTYTVVEVIMQRPMICRFTFHSFGLCHVSLDVEKKLGCIVTYYRKGMPRGCSRVSRVLGKIIK